jgi:hypothetical protein
MVVELEHLKIKTRFNEKFASFSENIKNATGQKKNDP